MGKKRTLDGVYNSLVKPCLQEEKRQETPGTVYYTVGMQIQACTYDEITVSTANPGKKETDSK